MVNKHQSQDSNPDLTSGPDLLATSPHHLNGQGKLSSNLEGKNKHNEEELKDGDLALGGKHNAVY